MVDKKALKQAYKQQTPTMGVFQLLNKQNGKILLEGATDIQAKWNRHRTELKMGSHRNMQLQQDWNSQGEEHFEFSILSELKLDDDAKVNVKDEVKLLTKMVEEEMKLSVELKY